jgi:hypothetical protein
MVKKKGVEKMMSVQEVAAKLNKPPSSIRIWAAKGRFPGAERVEPEYGVPYWLIPQSAVDNFEARRVGRPPKQEAENKRRRDG